MKTVTIVFVISSIAWGIEAPLPIASLSRQAEAIVVGRASGVATSGGNTSVSFLVERSIAGVTVIPGSLIAITGNARGGMSPNVSRRSLCFLRRQGTQWTIIPRIENSTEFNRWCFSGLSDADVTRLLGGRSPSNRPLAEILLAFAVLGPADPHDLDQALSALPDSSYDEYLGLLAEPANNSVRLAMRLRHSDPAAVAELEKSKLPANVLAQVANQMCVGYMSPDRDGLAALGRLALSNSAPKRVRVCAAYALKSIHVSEALPLLAQLTGAADPDLRFEGVFGLAAAANSGHMPGERPLRTLGKGVDRIPVPFWNGDTLQRIPTPVSFRADEVAYISFWTNWWSVNRSRFQ